MASISAVYSANEFSMDIHDVISRYSADFDFVASICLVLQLTFLMFPYYYFAPFVEKSLFAWFIDHLYLYLFGTKMCTYSLYTEKYECHSFWYVLKWAPRLSYYFNSVYFIISNSISIWIFERIVSIYKLLIDKNERKYLQKTDIVSAWDVFGHKKKWISIWKLSTTSHFRFKKYINTSHL